MTLTADADANKPSGQLLAQRLSRLAVRSGEFGEGARSVAEEVAIALTYNGGTQAVMMATPGDLQDFAVGFSLTERIIDRLSDLQTLEIVSTGDGIDIQMWLTQPHQATLAARRRHFAGPTGCGLCGVDSLAEAMRRPPAVADSLRLDDGSISDAIGSLATRQSLHRQTGAVHAAAFWRSAESLVCLREDVGRHNALDKLVGALARGSISGKDGVLLLTSRVSVEMVQKAAVLGTEILVAVSAPTALAVRVAEAAGITLIAIARADGFEVFTHPHRVLRKSGRTPHNSSPSTIRGQRRRRPNLLAVDDALAVVLEHVTPIEGEERVRLPQILSRIAAESIKTSSPLPAFDHSAMDGYGLSGADCDLRPPFGLKLVGTILAGAVSTRSIGQGETVRVLTGAPIPAGVAAVVMEERCQVTTGAVEFRSAASPGMNIRRRGEDAPAGLPIVSAGDRLGLQHVPILAACGIKAVTVRRKLRVAILSTGDELVAPDTELRPASIFDVNRALLSALLSQPWIDVFDLGIVADDPTQLAQTLKQAAASADVVLTSGGVSGSDADHMAAAIVLAGGHGSALSVALKPGKPLLTGAIGTVPVLGLPGNPLSALGNMILFGRALLSRRAGRQGVPKRGIPVEVASDLSRASTARVEMVPVSGIEEREHGPHSVLLTSPVGSARLVPLAGAKGVAFIPAEASSLARFLPFDDLWD